MQFANMSCHLFLTRTATTTSIFCLDNLQRYCYYYVNFIMLSCFCGVCRIKRPALLSLDSVLYRDCVGTCFRYAKLKNILQVWEFAFVRSCFRQDLTFWNILVVPTISTWRQTIKPSRCLWVWMHVQCFSAILQSRNLNLLFHKTRTRL